MKAMVRLVRSSSGPLLCVQDPEVHDAFRGGLNQHCARGVGSGVDGVNSLRVRQVQACRVHQATTFYAF